jgi:parallel beta-helix repeat protein
VHVVFRSSAAICGAALVIAGCAERPPTVSDSAPVATAAGAAKVPASNVNVVKIAAGTDAPKRAQAALINAKAGDVIELGEGQFDFKSTLSLDVSHVTLKGQGADKTILSFKNQGAGTGGEGLSITSKDDVTLADLAIEDARGDGIKVNGTKRIIVRNIRAEWTGGPKETNGGYGIYPVLCTDVLIEDCKVTGASDAGIYVGQSTNIVVRRNTAEKNVAGIEIENSNKADVYQNWATDNSGGILVFTMPDLPTKDGLACRVYSNKVLANNHANFAPKGNIVATVPPGTGIMIMANDQVEVFDNTIEKNQTAGLSIVSYLLTERPLKDEKYDPYCEAIHVYGNHFAGNGTKPAGPIGEMLAKALGSPLPDILYDGIIDPKKQVGGKLPDALAVRIHNNGEAGFVNFDAPALTAAAAGSGSGKAPHFVRDLKEYAGTLPSLAPVSIEGLQ